MTLQTVKPSSGPWTHTQRKWTHSVLQSSVEAQTTAPASDVAIEIMDKENPWLWNKHRGHREQWTKDLLLWREAWSNQSLFSVLWPSSSWSCPEFYLMCFPFFYFLYWTLYCSDSVFASLLCIVLVMVEEAEDLAFIFLVTRTQVTPLTPLEEIVCHTEIKDCEIRAASEWDLCCPLLGGWRGQWLPCRWKEGWHRYLVRKRPSYGRCH